MKRYSRSKTDANHRDLCYHLRRVGCSVLDLSGVGHGCPDALVARNGKMWLMEFKDGSKSPSRQALTVQQEQFMLRWKGPKVCVVTSVDEALKVVL